MGLGPRTDKGFGLAVTLTIALPGLNAAEAEALVAEADTICPYSHAVRGNIAVRLEIAGQSDRAVVSVAKVGSG